MAIAQRYVAQQYGGRGGPSGLADVLEVLLDKGLVIDAFVRVSLVGIELLTVDARVVVASVDTYLHFAEAVNRLDLLQANNSQALGDLVGGSSGRSRGSGRSDDKTGEERANGSSNEDPAAHTAELQAASNDQQPSSEERSEQRQGEPAVKERESETGEGGLLSRLKQRGQAF